jgi:hypothetical protein
MTKSTNMVTDSRFSIKTLYLLLAIAGTIFPWFWLLQDPAVLMSPALFLQLAFGNNVAIDLTGDLLISASVFFCFVWVELRRLKVSLQWFFLYLALTLGVGLSCALPFFLYRRELILEQNGFRQRV